MSQAVICDKCGQVVKLREAVTVDILRCRAETIYSGHLCPECKPVFSFEDVGSEILATENPDRSLSEKYRYKQKPPSTSR